MKCTVYGLYSSRNPDELRYIGQTTQEPPRRLSQHRSYAKCKTTAVHKWFAREISDGFQVELRVLIHGAMFNESEISLIAEHKAIGARLLNHTEGGEGTVGWSGNKGNKRPDLAERNRLNTGKPGHPLSPANRAKLIAANTGRKRPDTVARNLGNTLWLGRTHSEETKKKIGDAHRGKIVPPEVGRKISAARKGKVKLSVEAIARLRAGHKAYFDARRRGA